MREYLSFQIPQLIENLQFKPIARNGKMEKTELDSLKEQVMKMEIFENFSEEEVTTLLGEMTIQKVLAEEDLFLQGDKVRDLHIVTKGHFIVKRHAFPEEQVVIELEAGELLGEKSFIDGDSRSSAAFAKKDSETILLSREKFDLLYQNHPELAYKFLMVITLKLSHRLREMTFRYVEIR